MSVRTRFAPSPTGFLHIGGARTALYNLLWARRHGGRYLLRIEDTDRARSTPEAVRQILDSLAWLGLSPDEEPVFQSAREHRHAAVARDLLARGLAYRAFETPEELAAMRERALAEKRPPRYDGTWRDREPGPEQEGRPFAIRIKAPRPGSTRTGERGGESVVEDLVQGTVRVSHAELDDMIILRSDGTPTYLHAVVVDDHDMGITHVIRGDDHLTNTFRQCMVYDAMGWHRPRFAHIPLIHGADGAKLSKRHGAVSVMEFREEGYLPEALCNYLLRLGWGHGDEEIIGRERAERLFDLADVGRAAARMDKSKLDHVNAVHLRTADPDALLPDVLRRLSALGHGFGTEKIARVRTLLPALQERARTLKDLAAAAAFAVTDGAPAADAKSLALLTPDARARLADLARFLASAPWERADLEHWLRDYAEVKGLKLKDVAQPLRVALTGSATSPPIDLTLLALGRSEATIRMLAAAEG